MAQLFSAGMALRQKRFDAPGDAVDTTAPRLDHFVDMATDVGILQGAEPSALDSKPARLILAVLCSLILHLLLVALLLFAPDPRPILPVLIKPDAIAISLVDMPAAQKMADAGPPATAPAPPRPVPSKKPVVRSARPVEPKAPAPVKPKPEPAPDLLPESMSPAAGESPLAAAAEGAKGGASPVTGAPSSSETVQASVPLYDANPSPVYPMAARRRSLEGTVLLDVLVNREGQAAQVRIARGSGHEMLDRSALDSVRQWRFRPARRGGRPLDMWVQVPVRFQLQ